MRSILSSTAVAALVAISCSIGARADCDMGGDWLIMDDPYLGGKFYPVTDLPGQPGTFNISMDIRHGPQTVPGRVDGLNVTIDYGVNETIGGTFAPNCSMITWEDSKYGPTWCRAWLPGCTFVEPPYGKRFSFWGTLGNNMVLQRGPAKAAVYGILVGNVTEKPSVNVTVQRDDGSSYSVPAEIGTVQQPWTYPGLEWPWNYMGPFLSWKAVLQPESAGGNYTILAECSDCEGIAREFTHANITNVTFGDVWYCSGQSNMWLPVANSFSRNDTLAAITQDAKYRNIHIMAGNSGEQEDGTFNPWMTALQASEAGSPPASPALFQFGAACWYFAQRLVDEMEAGGMPLIPLGLADTAVGGQRIEEYMDNSTISQCTERAGEDIPQWDGVLFGKLVLPFVDMTVNGFVWYQGENNMGGTKGNSLANVGYGCEMANLVASWRKLWSRVPGTTDPLAPFGIVTLASSGSEGGPDMGAMRWAQTANYGVLPNPAIPNSFVAQAYDLDDPWGPAAGPCFDEWQCCSYKHVVYNETQCNIGTRGNASMCDMACAAAAGTPVVMGGIHPRDKKPVGDRLGTAAFNTVYGGKKPFTGPTLAGCSVDSTNNQLIVTFNQTLLRGDEVVIQPYNQSLNMSYLEVQTDPSIFCVEVQNVNSSCRGNCPKFCPSWAGGSAITNNSALVSSDQGWSPLNISLASASSIAADLSPLGSAPPTAVRYAWGTSECCDKTDPTLYVTHPCGPAPCPLMSKDSAFPANPFIAKIVNGKCQCIAPQTCG